MILITGGAYQGKLEFAKSICENERPVIAEGEFASLEQLRHADIISHFHLWIRTLIKEGENPYALVEELLRENPKVFIELTQLGCGVVPMEKFDREYRETVGRIGCLLAERAKEVYLVNCGIAKKLK